MLDGQGPSHAVLVVRTDWGDLVLDNLTNAVRRWDATGYTFVRVQNRRDPRGWVAVDAGTGG